MATASESHYVLDGSSATRRTYGTHSVESDGELAQLDADGYRPLRPAALPSVD